MTTRALYAIRARILAAVLEKKKANQMTESAGRQQHLAVSRDSRLVALVVIVLRRRFVGLSRVGRKFFYNFFRSGIFCGYDRKLMKESEV